MKINITRSYGVRTDKVIKTWLQLSNLFNILRAKESQYLHSFDITMNQFQILEALYNKGDLSIGAITKLISTTPGNITVVVKNLKRDGLISSITDPKDKRYSILSITKTGEDLFLKLFPDYARKLESSFSVLENDELHTLFKLLRKLHKSQ